MPKATKEKTSLGAKNSSNSLNRQFETGGNQSGHSGCLVR